MLNFPFRFFFACAGSFGVYMYFFSLLSSQSIRFAWLLLGSVYVHLFYLGILLLSYLFDLVIYIYSLSIHLPHPIGVLYYIHSLLVFVRNSGTFPYTLFLSGERIFDKKIKDQEKCWKASKMRCVSKLLNRTKEKREEELKLKWE